MTRWLDFSTVTISTKEHTRRVILATRFKRLLPTFARRLQIDLDELHALAERSFFMCTVCLGALPAPVLYRDGERPIGVICGRCEAAIEKTGGDLGLLARHRRFNVDHAANRGRMARLIAMHSQ